MELASLLALALLSSAPPAEVDRLVMIPVIVGAKTPVTPSLIASAIAEASGDRPTLAMISMEEDLGADASARRATMLACGRDGACIARALHALDARLSLVVIVNEEIDPPLLGLILVGTADRRVIAESHAEVARGPEALRAALFERVSAMLDAEGYSRSARITVLLDPPRASVQLDGTIDPDPGTGSVFTVRGGRHALIARHPGYEDLRREVEVAAGEKITVEMALAETESVLDSPWLWIGALAFAAATTAGVALIVSATSDNCLCVTTASGTTCDQCR